MSRPFPAPKGHHAIAQGNALGMAPKIFPSPERAARFAGSRDSSPHGSAPSRREFNLTIEPRALPWAITLRPVGAFNRKERNP